MIDFFYQMMHGIDLLSALIFAFCFLFFVLFFTLGVWFLKKTFLPSFFFLLSFAVLLSIPFAIIYSSKLYFHKIEITHNNSRPLLYSDSFLIDIAFINRGKLPLKECLISFYPKRKSQQILDRIRDFVEPLQIRNFMINKKIGINEGYEFSKIIPYAYRGHDFSLEVDCR